MASPSSDKGTGANDINSTDDGSFPAMLLAEFGTSRLTPWLVVPATLLFIVSVVGIALNSSVVYVTARTKSLHGSCQFLLAFTCAAEVLHQAAHFVYLGVVTVGGNFIRFPRCFALQSPSVFGFFAIQASLLATALDRILAVYTPLFYKRLNGEQHGTKKWRKSVYLGTVTAVIASFSGGSWLYMFANRDVYADQLVACDISDILSVPLFEDYFDRTVFALNGLAVVCYVLVWIAIRKNVHNDDVQKRMFRSVLAIVVVNIGGYLLNFALMTLYFTVFLNWFRVLWTFYEFNVLLLHICAAANAPILYWISYDYRAAFQKHLLWWWNPTPSTVDTGEVFGTAVVVLRRVGRRNSTNNANNAISANNRQWLDNRTNNIGINYYATGGVNNTASSHIW